jgi:hypothetical protein
MFLHSMLARGSGWLCMGRLCFATRKGMSSPISSQVNVGVCWRLGALRELSSSSEESKVVMLAVSAIKWLSSVLNE